MSEEVFLKLEGVKKSFGGVHALKGVTLKSERVRFTVWPEKMAVVNLH